MAGAPFVNSPAGWQISLSGRGSDVVIAVGRVAVGVDIEPKEAAALWLDMLTPAEVCDILSMAAAHRPFECLRRWTMKEAVAKLIGQPLQIAPESIETQADGPSRFTARCGDWRAHGWTRINDDSVISLALTA
ncbi:MAG: 4'-phosphopantetheinyl transferase superfamily protein [Acetobacteraceae bacterium]|nr:4'-phosphopantetheinyl transferase superfamily protein [Acetobacteraceae bacterium]